MTKINLSNNLIGRFYFKRTANGNLIGGSSPIIIQCRIVSVWFVRHEPMQFAMRVSRSISISYLNDIERNTRNFNLVLNYF